MIVLKKAAGDANEKIDNIFIKKKKCG